MSGIDINSWSGFWDTFHLPIYCSLIGAVIGHYRKNGVIQMPIVVISYEKGPYFEKQQWFLKPIRWAYILLDFLLFLVGLRFHRSQEKEGIWIDLGFLGDMLIGIGTGILAKCALALIDSPSQFTVVSTSLLAGFAGLSYIQTQQMKDLDLKSEEQQEKYQRAISPIDEVGKRQIAAGIEVDEDK